MDILMESRFAAIEARIAAIEARYSRIETILMQDEAIRHQHSKALEAISLKLDALLNALATQNQGFDIVSE